jgi:UPF0755 protein
MPENTPSSDDPLAELYGRLPGPQNPSSTPPTSRRAARAARAQTGESAVQPSQPPAPTEPVRREPERVREPEPVREPESVPVPTPAGAHRGATAAGWTAVAHAADAPRASAPAGSLDDLFAGRSSTDELGRVPPKPNRRRRRAAGWIVFGIVLALLGGIAAGGLWVWNTYEDQIREFAGWEEPDDFEPGMANGEATISIESGDTGRPISQKMYDAGVTMTPDTLYNHLIDNGIEFPFQPGVYRLQLQMTAADALAALEDPANRLQNTVRLNEGWTVEYSLQQISEQMQIPIEDLEAAVADPSAYGVAADSLEGWLFPATYDFDEGVTAGDVVGRMVGRAVQALDAAEVPEGDRQRILTIASIIQREARFEDDFYRVSRVIQNRLDPGNQETFGLLQMDSTAQYGYGEIHDGTASSSAEALQDDNPWNTYVHTGLPVGPIANPGDLAIDAAMHPVDGPWLYFVTVNLDTGETVFTNTAAEHQRAVDQWIEWCRANPDSGC